MTPPDQKNALVAVSATVFVISVAFFGFFGSEDHAIIHRILWHLTILSTAGFWLSWSIKGRFQMRLLWLAVLSSFGAIPPDWLYITVTSRLAVLGIIWGLVMVITVAGARDRAKALP